MRQVADRFRVSAPLVHGWVSAQLLQSDGVGRIDEGSLPNVCEGTHYVSCRVCGRGAVKVTLAHVKLHGMNLSAYQATYPGAPIRSELCGKLRPKSSEQKTAQSQKLKDRFQTADGDLTRRQISEAATRMQAGDYGARAADHLRELNNRPEQKALLAAKSKARWDSGEQRAAVKTWQAEHPERVLASAAHARRHIRKHFTKLHAEVKEALVAAGLYEFQTEHEAGYYSIDEAMPGIRLAVEVDGCWWHGCQVCGHPGVGAIRACDARKTSYLVNRGWTIIRLAEHDIKADIGQCVQRVVDGVVQLRETRSAT